ncbi:MAG: hypothetical protein IPH28_14085 [Cytophagaceae bacterium]|nr:hypothetical protein [Cytophagaceae bacterium]
MLYKYPIGEFPYDQLVKANKERGIDALEYELVDTGIEDDNYFDIFIEYAKKDINDIYVKVSAPNRSNHNAPLTVLPTV